MGSPLGANTRRYHGLLIAAEAPPVERLLVLHSIIDELRPAHGPLVPLATHEFGPEHLRHPDGWRHLDRFEVDLPHACSWRFRTPAGGLVRTLRRPRGTSTATIAYTWSGTQAAVLCLRPLLPLRSMHEVGVDGIPEATFDGRRLTVRRGATSATLEHDGAGDWIDDAQWWRDFRYRHDADRGQGSVEDVPAPARVEIALPPGATVTLTCAVAHADRSERAHAIIGSMPPDGPGLRGRLLRASDQFVVVRESGADLTASIIAGYPWFADWGRDAMISVPGLLLATERLATARSVLETFAEHRRDGLLPNCFVDTDGTAMHNAADAPLWFVHALWSYVKAAGLPAPPALLSAALDIVDAYRAGAPFGIRCADDGLITAGEGDEPVTWMDARRGGHSFTPRDGKAIELSALWYNALCALADLVETPAQGAALRADADRVGAAIAAKFWWPQRRCLHDVLVAETDGDRGDERLRPNQLFAVSLPFSPLEASMQRSVLEAVETHLLTPYGLRTLDPGDPSYCPRYEGDLWQRDGAYHNGTVWPWLVGPYVDAVRRVRGDTGAADALRVFDPLVADLDRDGLGQIAEVYDADAPHRGSGCPAQAWSVAELLRVVNDTTAAQ